MYVKKSCQNDVSYEKFTRLMLMELTPRVNDGTFYGFHQMLVLYGFGLVKYVNFTNI